MKDTSKASRDNEKIKAVQEHLKVITDEMLAELAESNASLAKSAQEIMNFRTSITEETARGSVLMSAAFLDDRLKDLLKARLVNNNTMTVPVFDVNGALGTFSSRINFSYLLGLIPRNAVTDLHSIRGIRNIFAHSALPLKFEDPAVNKLCSKLIFHGVKDRSPPGVKFRRSVMALLTFIIVAAEEAQHIEPKENYDIPDRTDTYKIVSAVYESVTGEDYPIKSQHE
ncbi:MULTISPECIES: hypothetical protein [Pseudomonas]|uniref:hypothetical protein n=1 Tax=Pseudomonas TaxID=286 RepID=UPI0007306234|nr:MULTISPECIES: hypothetical protein [Pseudomonas]KTB69540.1 hypothetical protein AO068_22950 [Pseudomonas sp. ICMP 3272]KTC53086.1 hypothetical protein AO258_21640 [Pseudomonas syringae ICMP 19498]